MKRISAIGGSMKRKITITVLSFVGSLGCEPVAPEVDAPSFARAGPVVGSVSGMALYTDGGAKRTWSFNAVKHADGTVRGEWQGLNRSLGTGTQSHGDVICFTVEGNAAWIGGVIEQAPANPERVGFEFGWRVIDNGQGANAPPDQITRTLRIGRPGSDFCRDRPNIGFLHDLEAGNIQVR